MSFLLPVASLGEIPIRAMLRLKHLRTILVAGVALGVVALSAQAVPDAASLPPPAFAESSQAAYAFLERLCDDFGGRVTGSRQNRDAMQRLAGELEKLGLKPEFQTFRMPGWERRRDTVGLVKPLKRELRVAALAYTNPQRPFEADVVDIGKGAAADYPEGTEGKVGLLAHTTGLQMSEIVATARQRGIRAILFTNREAGGQLLARTGSFVGAPLPLPVFSVTQEEGLWLGRLLARNQPVRVRVETTSRCREVETANLVVRLAGASPDRIIVGAHFDSWDLGQGAMDNGLGVAQLYALAHALKDRRLARTLELVWFNGEEMGLWGSRHAARQLGNDPVILMLNLDMVGVPIGINAMGDDSLVPALERLNAARRQPLPMGVQNTNWLGSDHTPYQLAGVRTVNFHAPIDRASVRYYHDFADTIDKVPEKVLLDSGAIIVETVLSLLDDVDLKPLRRGETETAALFTRFDLERRMRAIGLWPFP